MGIGAPAIVTGQKFLLWMHHAGSVFEPVVQDNCGIFKILAIHGGENEKSDGRTAAKVDNKLPTLPCFFQVLRKLLDGIKITPIPAGVFQELFEGIRQGFQLALPFFRVYQYLNFGL